MTYCLAEISKILKEKLLYIFLCICLCINIVLCFINPNVRKSFNQLSDRDFLQSGEKIYDKYSGANLGKAYYNERYINSSVLNQLMKTKYDNLQNAIDRLNSEDADLSYYAGELTPSVHEALFERQLKALIIECMIFISLLCLRAFSVESQNETEALIYSSFRGRRVAKDKIIATGIAGLIFCLTLIVISLGVFFSTWDFGRIWDMNISGSFNLVHEPTVAVYLKPFITWNSFSVKTYLVFSLLLTGMILIAWWLISNAVALFIRNDFKRALILVAFLGLPCFGIMLFPELNSSVAYYLSTLTLSMVVLYSQWWFTDLGHYTVFAYQETGVVIVNLLAAVICVSLGIRYFRRKDMK